MSRIAKKPVQIPSRVEVILSGEMITVSGELGKLSQPISNLVNIKREGQELEFSALSNSKQARAMSGTLRAVVASMVQGVSVGFTKKLSLVGVGYRAQIQKEKLVLELGYSHLINFDVPSGIKVEVPTQTEIVIKGIDKQALGQVAAVIRSYRPPEPYKGKGVRYADEVVVIKETKKK